MVRILLWLIGMCSGMNIAVESYLLTFDIVDADMTAVNVGCVEC